MALLFADLVNAPARNAELFRYRSWAVVECEHGADELITVMHGGVAFGFFGGDVLLVRMKRVDGGLFEVCILSHAFSVQQHLTAGV